MKLLVALALLAGVAHAQPAKTKRAPDKFTKAASDAFTAAADADASGDLRAALALYEKAQAISSHPSTVYNIADVQRRLTMLRQAIRSYELYLVMAPDAKDRAEVEALIERLAVTPGKLVLYTSDHTDRDSLDLAAGYVLVDGDIAKKPGPLVQPADRKIRPEIWIDAPPGKHVVDFVTSLTYAHVDCEIHPGVPTYCQLRADPRIDGNTVIHASDHAIDVHRERNSPDLTRKRSELPPGKHRLLVEDRHYGCAPLAIDVAAGTHRVTYAFLLAREYDGLKRCRTLDIKQHRLQFEP